MYLYRCICSRGQPGMFRRRRDQLRLHLEDVMTKSVVLTFWKEEPFQAVAIEAVTRLVSTGKPQDEPVYSETRCRMTLASTSFKVGQLKHAIPRPTANSHSRLSSRSI